jgi:hypothetical protein
MKRRPAPAHLRALAFIASHPGTRRPAFPWGHSYRFDAPELKRAPFRVGTVNALVEQGLVDVTPVPGDDPWFRNESVTISAKGQALVSKVAR